MRGPVGDAIETCPECGERLPVPKHSAFLRCALRRDGRRLGVHGWRSTWFACCGIFGVSNATYGWPQHRVATYVPSTGWSVTADPLEHPQFDISEMDELAERMDFLAAWAPDDARPGPVRFCLHYKSNFVETVHHEMLSFWLATAGAGKPVVIADATPCRLPSTYWPEGAARCERVEDWAPALRGALHDPETELPLVYQSWPTFDPAARGMFRRFLDVSFGPPQPEGPLLLVCLRWQKRRWAREISEEFLRLCRERLSARIVVQGVAPEAQRKGPNGTPPAIPDGVEALIGASIPAQVAAARQATYCVVPHGAAMLWSWVSGAPTLEMYPSREVCSNTLLAFSNMPLGANVLRVETNSTAWNGDFDEPTAEETFAAMLEHAEESGAALV